jgi:hypothetical protein
MSETGEAQVEARRIAEAYLGEPEYVNDPAKYPFLPEVLLLSRAYLALLSDHEEREFWKRERALKVSDQRAEQAAREEAAYRRGYAAAYRLHTPEPEADGG